MIDPACWFPGRYTEVFASRDSKSSRNWHGSFLSSEQYKRWKNDKKCTISMRPDVGESFGANIFTLLKDSFYLKRPLGEFAHARIEEVIRDLNKLKKNPNDKALRETCRGYKQLIDIIGEPVIRRKLQNLYADLFDTAPEDGHRRDLAELSRLLESGDPAQREKYRELLKNMLSDIKRS